MGGNFIRDTLPNFGRGKMKAIDYNSNTGKCSCKSENSAQCSSRVDSNPHLFHKYIRTGECNTGDEWWKSNSLTGTNAQKAEKCAALCRDTHYAGFIINTSGGCYCESASSATCGVDNDSWMRYDFTGPRVAFASKMKNTGATWYDLYFKSRKLGSKHLITKPT